TKTVHASPDFLVGRYRLGLALEAMRRFDEAMDQFEVARQLSGGAPAATAALGYVLAMRAAAQRPGRPFSHSWRRAAGSMSPRPPSPKCTWRSAISIEHSSGSASASQSDRACW